MNIMILTEAIEPHQGEMSRLSRARKGRKPLAHLQSAETVAPLPERNPPLWAATSSVIPWDTNQGCADRLCRCHALLRIVLCEQRAVCQSLPRLKVAAAVIVLPTVWRAEGVQMLPQPLPRLRLQPHSQAAGGKPWHCLESCHGECAQSGKRGKGDLASGARSIVQRGQQGVHLANLCGGSIQGVEQLRTWRQRVTKSWHSGERLSQGP